NARQLASCFRRTHGPAGKVQGRREGGDGGWLESEGLEPGRIPEQRGKRLIAGERATVEHQPALERLGGERQVVRDHQQRRARRGPSSRPRVTRARSARSSPMVGSSSTSNAGS